MGIYLSDSFNLVNAVEINKRPQIVGRAKALVAPCPPLSAKGKWWARFA
jgi:hypothetical protein